MIRLTDDGVDSQTFLRDMAFFIADSLRILTTEVLPVVKTRNSVL